MIDYEQKIFNAVRPAVINKVASGGFKSVYVQSDEALPAVSFMEMDNSTVKSFQTNTPTENLATITYEVQIYATTKARCRDIFKALDDAMLQLNFNRLSGTYVPNLDNIKVFRYVARYEANIDRNGVIYRKLK